MSSTGTRMYLIMLSIFLGLAFIFAGLRQIGYAIKEDGLVLKITRYVSSALMIFLAVYHFANMGNTSIFPISALIYIFSIIIYVSLTFIEKHSIRNIIYTSLRLGILVTLVLAALTGFAPGSRYVACIIYSGLMAILGVFGVLVEAFSKIRFKTITKILRKTFAAEIILGLFFLIFAFSVLFTLLEGMPYGDALWFCFATVTTIGYGDFTVVGLLSRILAVILGIYGIIVVALITSVIVNLYNETKENADGETNQ